jgi:hypothetical protein
VAGPAPSTTPLPPINNPEATRALLARVREVLRAGRAVRTRQMGGGRTPYEELPEDGALLIGFSATYGRFGRNATIKTICPIFLMPTGRVGGIMHGVPGEGLVRVEAQPGYAIGAVTIRAGAGVDGLSVTFMEIRENGLNPERAYESEWLGGAGGHTTATLGGTGAPIVGIFGKTASTPRSTFNGLGLITATLSD